MSWKRQRIVIAAGMLTLAGLLGTVTAGAAAEAAADKDYVAVFRRGSTNQPFAVIEKPKGVAIGKGTNIEIDAFALRVEAMDAGAARAFLQHQGEVDGDISAKLPPDVKVYSDKRYVEADHAASSQKYTLRFTDPADASGMGGGGGGGGGSGY